MVSRYPRQINLRVSDEQRNELDRIRGNVARERLIRAMVQRALFLYGNDDGFDARDYVDHAERELDGRSRRLAELLDERRGAVPRSRFIFDLLESALEVTSGNSKGEAGGTGGTGGSGNSEA